VLTKMNTQTPLTVTKWQHDMALYRESLHYC
jgi:hypothetical protein